MFHIKNMASGQRSTLNTISSQRWIGYICIAAGECCRNISLRQMVLIQLWLRNGSLKILKNMLQSMLHGTKYSNLPVSHRIM